MNTESKELTLLLNDPLAEDAILKPCWLLHDIQKLIEVCQSLLILLKPLLAISFGLLELKHENENKMKIKTMLWSVFVEVWFQISLLFKINSPKLLQKCSTQGLHNMLLLRL